MEGGFGGSLEDPQFGFAGPMQQYPDNSNSSMLTEPDEPTWVYTYDGPVVSSDLYGINGYGVVFDDFYNGIFDVDAIIDNDEPSDYNGTYDLSEEE